jgi:hypothetical protein
MSVLRQQASHLLLIRTNLGYGTVLTEACGRQGCSATGYYYYYYYHHQHTGTVHEMHNRDSALYLPTGFNATTADTMGYIRRNLRG